MANQNLPFIVTVCLHLLFAHFKIVSCTFPLDILPDKPTNVTVTNITSRGAKIFWLDPKNRGKYDLLSFWIGLKKDNSLILTIVTGKVNEYEIDNLTPFTTYEISVAAGNGYGLGENTITSFLTSEEGEW